MKARSNLLTHMTHQHDFFSFKCDPYRDCFLILSTTLLNLFRKLDLFFSSFADLCQTYLYMKKKTHQLWNRGCKSFSKLVTIRLLVCEFHPIFIERDWMNSWLYMYKFNGVSTNHRCFFFWFLLIYVCNTSTYVCMCVDLL